MNGGILIQMDILQDSGLCLENEVYFLDALSKRGAKGDVGSDVASGKMSRKVGRKRVKVAINLHQPEV